jgi:hypothetical protein
MKPVPYITKLFPYVSEPFRHITNPLPYITKSFHYIRKPFFYITKSIFYITKRLLYFTKWPSDLKSLPGASSILPGAKEMSLPCMVRGFPMVAPIESSSSSSAFSKNPTKTDDEPDHEDQEKSHPPNFHHRQSTSALPFINFVQGWNLHPAVRPAFAAIAPRLQFQLSPGLICPECSGQGAAGDLADSSLPAARVY